MCKQGGHRRSRQAALPAAAFYAGSLLLASALLTPQASAAPAASYPATPESEVVLILDLDGETISDSFVALERAGRLFVPVCAVAEAASLSISCEEDRAYGFILKESRPIVIDLKEGYTILGRDSFKIRDAAFLHGSEMFADIAELSRWLPIDFQYREDSSTVKMVPREMLPAQGFKKRRRLQNPAPPAVPRQYDDFTPARALASVPTVDLTSQLSLSGARRVGTKSSLLNGLGMSGDLLYLSGEAHLFAENETLKRFDLALSRRSEAGFKVGPLPVTQLVVGAAQIQAIDGIGADSTPLYGLMLSNRPLSGASQFLSHDIDGYLPAGWDAELFHNGAPIGYQPPSQDGMYHFKNLRVQYGLNDFKVILHGPFGETRESEQTFFSDATTPKGEFLYTLSGAWQTGLTPSEAGGPGRASNLTLTSDFGISKELAGSALLMRQADSTGVEQDYAGFGVRTALGYTLISVDLVQSFSPQSGLGGELLTARSSSRDVFGVAVQVEQRLLRDFHSLRYPKAADPLFSQTLVKSNYSLAGWDEIRLPLYLEVGLDARRSGAADWSTVGRVTGGWNGWNGALETDVASQLGNTIASSMLQISTRVQGISVRGQLGLTLAPEVTASAINVNADKDLGFGYQLNAGFIHDPASGISELRVGWAKRLGLVGYAVSATGSTSGAYSVNVGISTSLAADRFNRQAVVSAEALAPSGMIAVSALTAGSGDSPGKPLPGIGFLVNGNRAAATVIGSKGAPVVAFLPPDLPVDITVDLATVEDPFMVPKENGCHIIPRAGVVSACRFTMITGGEIDGMVLVKLKSEEVPLKGVRLDLVPAGVSGAQVLASTQTEESGYYVFKGVKPGSYRIVISEAEIARLRTSSARPIAATMPEGGDQVSGKDFLLEVLSGKPAGGAEGKGP
jgi:hypothetical protein